MTRFFSCISIGISLRPAFAIFVLAALALTFSSSFFLQRAAVGPSERGVPPPPRRFNSTLLQYAAVDLGQAQLKREIARVLDDTDTSLGRHRLSVQWRRFRVRDLSSSPTRESADFWADLRRDLNVWRRAMVYEPEIMAELKKIGIGGRRNSSFGSCAVVGNSGILLRTEYGGLIDSHDTVIRLNNAKTVGFAKHVGTKTTISFVNSNILHQCARRTNCPCQPYGPRVPVVLYLCQALHLLDYALCNSSTTAAFVVTDPRFDVLCGRIVKYYSLRRFAAETGRSLEDWSGARDGPAFHYSSGMQAVMLAVGVCEKVGIFGFGTAASAKHHYHTSQKAELHLHDYVAEMEFYRDLVNRPLFIPFVPDSFSFPSVTLYQ